MDSNWETDKLRGADLTRAVNKIHLVAFKNEANSGDERNPPNNHWCLFLELPNRKSVRFDMILGWESDSLRGKIEVSSRDYTSTTNAIKTLSYDTHLSVTVDDILRLITRHGLQKYQFQEEWEGCRYWHSVFVSKLEEAQYISEGSAEVALDALGHYWINPRGKTPRSIRKGSFRR